MIVILIVLIIFIFIRVLFTFFTFFRGFFVIKINFIFLFNFRVISRIYLISSNVIFIIFMIFRFPSSLLFCWIFFSIYFRIIYRWYIICWGFNWWYIIYGCINYWCTIYGGINYWCTIYGGMVLTRLTYIMFYVVIILISIIRI